MGFWYAGLPTVITSKYVADSWVIEHNTYAGSLSVYRHALVLADATSQNSSVIAKATNFIFRNNIFWSGTAGAPFAGAIYPNQFVDGTNAILPAWTTAPIVHKNVYFGPAPTLGNYTSTDGGYGRGHNTAFNVPEVALGKRQRFTKDLKLEAVRLLQTSGRPATEVARKLGLRRNQLYKMVGAVRPARDDRVSRLRAAHAGRR